MQAKLPVKKILMSAITLPVLYYRQLLQIGWPLILVTALSVVVEHLNLGGEDSYLDEGISFISGAATLVVLVMAVVGCHRLFIFAQKEKNEYKFNEWTGNEIRYAGWWILIGIGSSFVALPLILLVFLLGYGGLDIDIENTNHAIAVASVIGIPVYYFVSRWSMVLPASATDLHGKDLTWSWRLSSNNGWRLTVLIGIIPFSVELLFGFIPENPSVILELLAEFVWLVVGVIEVGLLSLSYAFLRSQHPEEIDGVKRDE